MIKTKTVLILGAGASADFGFPTGEGLFNSLCNDLQHPAKNPTTIFLIKCGYSDRDLQAFRSELFHSGLKSVDRFLENQDKWNELGKHAIASALLPLEKTDALFETRPHGRNWYKLLYERLMSSIDDLANNQLAILTYNYDRSLEQFFITAFSNTFGRPREQCVELLQHIPIVHLHGSLSPLRVIDPKGLSYGIMKVPADVQQAAQSIKIIHELKPRDHEFGRAHKLLSEADKICFLGFGYNLVNLERLQLKALLEGRNPSIRGTAVGLGANDRRRIRSYLSGQAPGAIIELSDDTRDIDTFIREYDVVDLF